MSETAAIVRFALAAATVALLLFGLAYAGRYVRRRIPALGTRRAIAVSETALLAHGAALHLVRVDGRSLLIGSGTAPVTLVCELAPERELGGAAGGSHLTQRSSLRDDRRG